MAQDMRLRDNATGIYAKITTAAQKNSVSHTVCGWHLIITLIILLQKARTYSKSAGRHL